MAPLTLYCMILDRNCVHYAFLLGLSVWTRTHMLTGLIPMLASFGHLDTCPHNH